MQCCLMLYTVRLIDRKNTPNRTSLYIEQLLMTIIQWLFMVTNVHDLDIVVSERCCYKKKPVSVVFGLNVRVPPFWL